MTTQWLIVDDDAVFARTLQRQITARGGVVNIALSASEALEQVKNLPLDRIVLDMKLGADSGLRLIEPIAALQPQAKIVMLTGYASIPTAVSAIKRGAWNFVMKPIDLDVLVAAFDDDAELPEEAIEVMSPKRIEWEHIQRTLDQNNGNISATARMLGMHRRTLQRKLQKRPVKK